MTFETIVLFLMLLGVDEGVGGGSMIGYFINLRPISHNLRKGILQIIS